MESGPGVRISLRIDAETRVAACGFETAAFDEARAVASRLCRAILGATIAQASAVSIPDVAAMSGLPVGDRAVRTVHFAKSAALLPWLGRRARSGAAITCNCFQVPTATIVDAIRSRGLRTVADVCAETKAGTGCGSCRPDLQRMLDESAGEPPTG